MKKLILAAVNIMILILLFMIIGCKKEVVLKDINLPATPVLSVKNRWGVIESSHLRLRKRATVESPAITTLWRGYVLQIVSQGSQKEIIEDNENYWYQINYDGLNGWVFGSYLKLFATKDTAERASKELK